MRPINLFGAGMLTFVTAAVLPAGLAVAQHHGGGHHGGHGGHHGGHSGHHGGHSGHHGGHGGHHGGHGFYGGFGSGWYGGSSYPYYGGYGYGGYYQPYNSYYQPGSSYYREPVVVQESPMGSVASETDASTFGGLASHLEAELNRLCLDMHYNYARNPGFKETYREAYGMLETAKLIRAMGDQGDREAMGRRVQELDDLFYQVRAHISGWSRDHQRQVGAGGVNTKIDIVESSLHSLMKSVGVVHRDRNAPPQPMDVEGGAGPAPGPPTTNQPALGAPPEPRPSP